MGRQRKEGEEKKKKKEKKEFLGFKAWRACDICNLVQRSLANVVSRPTCAKKKKEKVAMLMEILLNKIGLWRPIFEFSFLQIS